jgi:hypothetical protein
MLNTILAMWPVKAAFWFLKLSLSARPISPGDDFLSVKENNYSGRNLMGSWIIGSIG